MAREQEQFLDAADRDTAERKWRAVLCPSLLRTDAIAPVAAASGLVFIPLSAEPLDFVIPEDRHDPPAVSAFLLQLAIPEVRRRLVQAGFPLEPEPRR